MTTILLCYEIVRLVELKLGLLRGVARGVEFQPTMFDRINQIVSKPVLLLFLLSSVASLLISALITLRLRNGRSAIDHPNPFLDKYTSGVVEAVSVIVSPKAA